MPNDAKKTLVSAAAKTEKKTNVKKAAVKTAAKKTADTKTTDNKATAKKPAAKKTAAKKTSVESKVYIQFFGKQVTTKDVLDSCEADYKSNNKAAIKSIEVYVKPEDDVAYYVVNGDIQGKVSL